MTGEVSTPNPGERAFERVLVIMFENQYRGYVMANPYMATLAKQGRDLASFFGVMHPSQTNYIASIAGSLCNVTSDEPLDLIDERTIVDLIEEAPGDLTWRAYMESYVPASTPWTPDFSPADDHPYYLKHNPFSSFTGIVRNEARWERVVSEAQFFADVLTGDLPEYAWFTPNIWSDGHWIDGTKKESVPRAPALVDQLALWLEGFFGELNFPGPNNRLPDGTLVVVTFDEADFEADYLPHQASPYDGPNQIYTVLLGDGITPGVETEGYNHYSLLRTIQKNFGLEDLGRNDARSNWLRFLWGERFQWLAPAEISAPQLGFGPIAATSVDGDIAIASVTEAGEVLVTRSDTSGVWLHQDVLSIGPVRCVAISTHKDLLTLIALTDDGGALCMQSHDGVDWFEAQPPETAGPGQSISMHRCGDEMMVVIGHEDGTVTSTLWDGQDWTAPASIAAAHGAIDLTLSALGPSVLLVFRHEQDPVLRAVTYNTAPFNVVWVPLGKYGGPRDNTTIGEWSPCAFDVNHFSTRSDADGEQQPHPEPYLSRGPLAMAVLDGVAHLLHGNADGAEIADATFSLSGLMTPAEPVTVDARTASTLSNGYGTLAEAGWTLPEPIPNFTCDESGTVAVTRVGADLVAICQPAPGAPLLMVTGTYQDEHEHEHNHSAIETPARRQGDPMTDKATAPAGDGSAIAYLVESIPTGLDDLRGTPGVRYTEHVLADLVNRATDTIDLTAMYWALCADSDRVESGSTRPFSDDELDALGAREGRALFDALRDAADRGVRIRILQAPSQGDIPDPPEPQQLKECAPDNVELHTVAMGDWYGGGGIMHQKIWVFDASNLYIGSANMDWKSITQVKEMGVAVENCPELAADATAYLEGWFRFADHDPASALVFDPSVSIDRMVPNWSELVPEATRGPSPLDSAEFATSFNHDTPHRLHFNGSAGHVYLTGSPAEVRGPGRTWDQDALVNTILEARTSLCLSVMDFAPISIYGRKEPVPAPGDVDALPVDTPVWWSDLSDALLTAALTHKVHVRMLISKWAHTSPYIAPFLRAISAAAVAGASSPYQETGSLEIRQFRIPGWDHTSGADAVFPSHTRVNHTKYIVSERRANIGTSNMTWGYFASTAGSSFNTDHVELVDTLQSVFDRDWMSPYAHSV